MYHTWLFGIRSEGASFTDPFWPPALWCAPRKAAAVAPEGDQRGNSNCNRRLRITLVSGDRTVTLGFAPLVIVAQNFHLQK